MGKLIYGAPAWTAEFDDRALAHLRIVILAKLRRGESFSFSWRYEATHGAGRSTLWFHPSIPLQFEFFGGREPGLNRAWIDALMVTANLPSGLELVPEPDAAAANPKTAV